MVIQLHVIGMVLSSFNSGSLINRFGARRRRAIANDRLADAQFVAAALVGARRFVFDLAFDRQSSPRGDERSRRSETALVPPEQQAVELSRCAIAADRDVRCPWPGKPRHHRR